MSYYFLASSFLFVALITLYTPSAVSYIYIFIYGLYTGPKQQPSIMQKYISVSHRNIIIIEKDVWSILLFA